MKFEGDSQRLGTIIDGFTDLWWFGKVGKGEGEGLANRTTIAHTFIGRSHLPRWKSWVKQGEGQVGQKRSARR
jgi:hypothetical protein